MTPPQISAEQRAKGREAAVALRRAKSALKEDLRAGRVRAADVLALSDAQSQLDPVAARMRLAEVLLNTPGIGPAGAEEILAKVDISGQRRLAQLGPHQKERLRQCL